MDEAETRALRALTVRAILAGALGMAVGLAAVKLMQLAGGRFDAYATVVWVPWLVLEF